MPSRSTLQLVQARPARWRETVSTVDGWFGLLNKLPVRALVPRTPRRVIAIRHVVVDAGVFRYARQFPLWKIRLDLRFQYNLDATVLLIAKCLVHSGPFF